MPEEACVPTSHEVIIDVRVGSKDVVPDGSMSCEGWLLDNDRENEDKTEMGLTD